MLDKRMARENICMLYVPYREKQSEHLNQIRIMMKFLFDGLLMKEDEKIVIKFHLNKVKGELSSLCIFCNHLFPFTFLMKG